ncbi:MAG: hypothetical protein CML17_07935 [Pusillimonas sp.]|nr:hypothetical protein [Pusillimonas sp.]
MSANLGRGKSRRPNQATEEEIKEFFEKTKNILGKAGLYYDPITKTQRKAVEQNGKEKGSGRSLKLNRKFAGYLRKLSGEQAEILKDASARAIDKGFSKLQKERKLLKRDLKEKLETKPTAEEEASAPKQKTGQMRGGNKQEDKQVKKKNKIPDAEPKQTLLKQKVQEKKQKTAVAEGVREIVGERAKGLEKMAKNIRKNVIMAESPDELKQKEKIQNVAVNDDGSVESLEKASGTVDDVKLEEAQPQAPPEEPPTESDAIPEQPEQAQTEQATPEAPQTTTQNVDATTPEEKVVEEIRPVPQATPSFVSPSAQKVSMERNRMKYSPEKLRDEIKAFITIYRDDIKTERFKKLAKTKLEGLPLEKLRELHRNIEEEVIEYYGKQTGLRLGVIIDPAVLGLSVQRLQGALAPQVALPSGPIVRDVGSTGTQRDITGGRQITKSVDTHYAVGGLLQATGQVLPEGKKLQVQHDPNAVRREKNMKFTKTRLQIPIKPPKRHLFQPKRTAKKPSNIIIKS